MDKNIVNALLATVLHVYCLPKEDLTHSPKPSEGLLIVALVPDATDGFTSTRPEPHLGRFPNGVKIYYGKD